MINIITLNFSVNIAQIGCLGKLCADIIAMRRTYIAPYEKSRSDHSSALASGGTSSLAWMSGDGSLDGAVSAAIVGGETRDAWPRGTTSSSSSVK